jgi:hypothetical protein
MTNYKEKALHHLKRKTFPNFWKIEEELGLVFMYETKLNKFFKSFGSWAEAYQFLYFFTRTTKRNWVEDKIDCRLVIWDTDLEPEEQDCVDYMLEFFNYEQGSFELEELREILAENKEEENTVNACDILIKALIKHGKETIEAE